MGNILLSLKMVDKLNSLGTAKINSLLPPEVLEMILQFLRPADLMSAMLVCRVEGCGGGTRAVDLAPA